MSNVMVRLGCSLLGLMIATAAFAGGVDPREVSSPEPVAREKVTATPEQTSTAVKKARQVVAPAVSQPAVVREIPATKERSKPVTPSAKKDGWMVGSAAGQCAPLSSVNDKVMNVRFQTPQELGSQMHKRGHQAFVLDIGDRKDQVVRVKVPDLELDLTFIRAELCR